MHMGKPDNRGELSPDPSRHLWVLHGAHIGTSTHASSSALTSMPATKLTKVTLRCEVYRCAYMRASACAHVCVHVRVCVRACACMHECTACGCAEYLQLMMEYIGVCTCSTAGHDGRAVFALSPYAHPVHPAQMRLSCRRLATTQLHWRADHLWVAHPRAQAYTLLHADSVPCYMCACRFRCGCVREEAQAPHVIN